LLSGERISRESPQILGIDEQFFTRKHGYATTFCDLKNHKVHDVVLGRSEASLERYVANLPGKHQVKVVCLDLAASYRALVRKHFSAGPHCGRSFPRGAHRQSSFPGLLEGDRPAGSEESWSALAAVAGVAVDQMGRVACFHGSATSAAMGSPSLPEMGPASIRACRFCPCKYSIAMKTLLVSSPISYTFDKCIFRSRGGKAVRALCAVRQGCAQSQFLGIVLLPLTG
jgi:hypothetical protein